MEQDINSFIVFAAVVFMVEFQELLDLIPGDGFSGYTVVTLVLFFSARFFYVIIRKMNLILLGENI